MVDTLRIFVTVLPDVPEHRRLPLLVKLMSTIAEGDEEEPEHPHLWIMVGLLYEQFVANWVKKQRAKAMDPEDLGYKLQVGMISTRDACPNILTVCVGLLVVEA